MTAIPTSRTGGPPAAGSEPPEPEPSEPEPASREPDPVPARAAGAEPPEPGDPHWRVRHLWPLHAVSAALLTGAAVVGALLGGRAAAAGAVLGVATVVVSYTVSTVVIAWADTVAPRLVLPLGLMTYATKLAIVGGVIAAAANAGWPNVTALAVGVVAGVVGWTAAQIWWITRASPR